jgi:predicted nucleic-acid-binding Zn-ribbon protein
MKEANSHWRMIAYGDEVISHDARSLWANACKYFEHCDSTPILNKTTIKTGKEVGKVVTEEQPRLYTIKGLCLHCGITEEYLRDIRQGKDKTSEFYLVVSKVLYLIWVQNVEYAAVGQLNPIFISKLLNMDKPEELPVNNIRIELVEGLPALAQSEADILDAIEAEGKNYDLSS